FFERAEVKHALAYLRLIENPDDDGAFLRVVNFPARGIGARTLENLQDQARSQQVSLHRAVPTMSGSGGTRLLLFVQLIARLREATTTMSLPDSIDEVLTRSGLLAHYEQEREGQERIENLKELVNAATAYLAEGGIDATTPASAGLANAAAASSSAALLQGDGTRTGETDGPAVVQVSPLAGFLAHASLESGDAQADDDKDAVQLMTVHAAKGLEFDTVFVTGLEEGLFPHESSATEVDGLEEERRLMYVAMTRARRRLYLSLAQMRMLHGKTRYNMRSRFLGELPERALKWLSTQAMPAWGDMGGMNAGGAAGGRAAPGTAYGGFAGNRLSRAVHERASQAGWSRPADPGIPAASGGKALAGRDSRFRIGQRLRHARFGEGVVLGIEGNGDDARIQIRFGSHGTKWLALAVAKLDPA
ncbi:MAG: 3'-5' exonuclease, partial [Lautropia sp.]|nr:3'-5' exonuclease [Lautropia sp.]